jgi:aspartate/glutamate racemase
LGWHCSGRNNSTLCFFHKTRTQQYLGELLRGTFPPETRRRLVEIVEPMRLHENVEAVVLAGTELPLILRAETVAGLPLLDTTQIRVRAAVGRRNPG